MCVSFCIFLCFLLFLSSVQFPSLTFPHPVLNVEEQSHHSRWCSSQSRCRSSNVVFVRYMAQWGCVSAEQQGIVVWPRLAVVRQSVCVCDITTPPPQGRRVVPRSGRSDYSSRFSSTISQAVLTTTTTTTTTRWIICSCTVKPKDTEDAPFNCVVNSLQEKK